MRLLGRIVHFFLKIHLRICLPLYFGRFRVTGLEHVPVRGPVIFAANHQNTLLDALITGSVTRRNPYFITRGDVFRYRPIANFFRGLKMIPVFRFRDGLANVKKNADALQQARSLLKNKKSILIFPEGNHEATYYLRPLQKGIARLGLDTEAEKGYQLGILILPVGIYYESFEKRGYPAMIRFGQPITLKKYFNDYRINPQRAYSALLSELSEKMESLMIHIAPATHYEIILKSWRDSRKRHEDLLMQLESDQALIGKMSAQPERQQLASVNEPERLFMGHSGWVNFLRPFHILPERLTDFLAEKMIADRDFAGSVRFVATIIIYPIFYLLYIFFMVWGIRTIF